MAFEALFRRTLNFAAIHPREVVKQAIKHNAASVILIHNHPLGQLKPSDEEILVTGTSTYSFAENGLL